jgi:hypothetical protein
MKSPDINPKKRLSETTQNAPTSIMEAIACGVRVRFEDGTGYSKKVIDETINAARALGITNAEIERWAIQRRNNLAQDTKRLKEIKTLLNKARAIRMISEAKRRHS